MASYYNERFTFNNSNWWAGHNFSDWSVEGGSRTYQNGLAAGLSEFGGDLFHVNGDGSRSEYKMNKLTGEYGFWSYQGVQASHRWNRSEMQAGNVYFTQSFGVHGTWNNVGGFAANQGGHNGNDLDPSTVGHNWLWSVYIGPNNPMSYDRKRSDYSTSPSGMIDLAAFIHDKNYDRLHISGPMGVFTETKAIGADYQLIGSSLNAFANPYGLASPLDRLKGLTVGLGIFLGTLPKVIAYPVIQGAKSIPANEFPRL